LAQEEGKQQVFFEQFSPSNVAVVNSYSHDFAIPHQVPQSAAN
jgi:hypothetical protein